MPTRRIKEIVLPLPDVRALFSAPEGDFFSEDTVFESGIDCLLRVLRADRLVGRARPLSCFCQRPCKRTSNLRFASPSSAIAAPKSSRARQPCRRLSGWGSRRCKSASSSWRVAWPRRGSLASPASLRCSAPTSPANAWPSLAGSVCGGQSKPVCTSGGRSGARSDSTTISVAWTSSHQFLVIASLLGQGAHSGFVRRTEDSRASPRHPASSHGTPARARSSSARSSDCAFSSVHGPSARQSTLPVRSTTSA